MLLQPPKPEVIVTRILSLLFAVLAALAGLVALSYTLSGIEDLKFFKGAWLGGALGILVPGVLAASAFYMSARFFNRSFPRTSRRPIP